MDLRNFQLAEPTDTIGLHGCGLYWDLHAFAELTQVTYNTNGNKVELRWIAPSVENPWGDRNNKFKGCMLQFRNVSILVIAQRESDPTDEDDCVASISPVTKPAVIFDAGEFRVKNRSDTVDETGLLFELQSGRTIEIHAESAELVPL